MATNRVLITGSNGFVGRSLKEHFSARPEEWDVLAPVRGELDLLDSAAVKAYLTAARPAVVVHCATVGGTRKTAYDAGSSDVVAANLRMFLNLSSCLPAGARMISMGSGAEYDLRAYTPKMTEGSFGASVPADAYGFSKYAISRYIEKAEAIVCLRIFGLFGRYEDYTFKFISNAIVKNLLGLPIVINRNVRFDYLYVEDFKRIVDWFARNAPRHAHYNVTPTESVDLETLAGLINSVAEKKSEIRVLNGGMNREYTGSNARLLAELPGFSFTGYREAVAELYAYYRDRLPSLDTETVKADPYLKKCRTE